MSHCQFWLVFLAVVLVDGWPRHHHKPKPGTKKKPLLIAYGKKGTRKSNVSKISFLKVLQNYNVPEKTCRFFTSLKRLIMTYEISNCLLT